MASKLRPIGHEDRLTLVDHLTELRSRLVISIVTLLVCFSFTFWQNDAILDIVSEPVQATQNLDAPKADSGDPLEQAARFTQEQAKAFRAMAPALEQSAETIGALGSAGNLTAAQRAQVARTSKSLAAAGRQVAQAAQALPKDNTRNLVTLGVTEPFTATLSVAFYAAVLLAMPMLLFQMYAFVLPAFSPKERKTALPLMLMVPVLFILGVVFGYFVVLNRAVDFLQNFNDDNFDILLQARDYFKFAIVFVASIGLLFQIPVGVLAITRLGITTPKQLAKNRGYVILVIAIVAAIATPTPDPLTMSLAMAPLIVLFEASLLLARWLDRVKPSTLRSRWDDDDDDEDEDEDEDEEEADADDLEAAGGHDEDWDGWDPDEDEPDGAGDEEDREKAPTVPAAEHEPPQGSTRARP